MPNTKKTILRDLGDGLILRRATPADTNELVEFNVRIHCANNPNDVNFITHWTRDLISGKHPTFKPGDFTIVEDTRKGEIVSSLNLFSQRWNYGGIEFPIGRPELVGTNPDYRKRGLIRTQFNVVHEWSAQRGHVLQAITGIPYFYRQFGYEMALELGADRHGHKSKVPKLAEGVEEPYRVRPATETDLPFIRRTYTQGMTHSLVSHVLSPKLWRYQFHALHHGAGFRVIETPQGTRVGFIVHRGSLPEDGVLITFLYELTPGTSWLDVTPSVLRYLAATGAEYAVRDKHEFEWLAFGLGTQHMAYEARPDLLRPGGDPYAFYVRVPDVPGFVQLLAPVLEERLAKSIAPRWTGELKLSFYRDGLRLAFEKGKLKTSEPWTPARRGESACFRSGTFLHLLFGLHTIEDLRRVNPECYVCNNDARVLLRLLFPKQASNVWAVC